MFYYRMNDGNEEAQFIIRIEIVNRAIDLVSDLLQQLNILMDDIRARSGWSSKRHSFCCCDARVQHRSVI